MSVVAAEKPQLTVLGIQRSLALQLFHRDVVCPNCTWTGHEADMLVIRGLRLLDVEIKFSRADLRNDVHKDKWWRYVDPPHNESYPSWRHRGEQVKLKRSWPPNIWKHYYVFPEAVLPKDPAKRAALIAELPPMSGIYTARPVGGWAHFDVVRRAKPRPDARVLEPHEAMHIARLISTRYWNRGMHNDAALQGREIRRDQDEGSDGVGRAEEVRGSV